MSQQLRISVISFVIFLFTPLTTQLKAQPDNLDNCVDNYEAILSTDSLSFILQNISPPDFSDLQAMFPGLVRVYDFEAEVGFAIAIDEFKYYIRQSYLLEVDVLGVVQTIESISYGYYECDFNFNNIISCSTNNSMFGFLCFNPITGTQFPDITSNYQYIPIWNYGDPIPDPDPNSEIDLCDPCKENVCVDISCINHNIFCPQDQDPVCGCDGKTYPNACVAENLFGIKEYDNGPCNKSVCIDSTNISDEPCILLYDPVCGCDGVTYPNACSADRSGVVKYTAGHCSDECIDIDIQNPDGTVYCPLLYAPVCGCNGVTYPNECYALMDGVKDFIEGQCKDIDCDSLIYVPLPIWPPSDAQDSCTMLGYDPVCGCDEITYDNACFAFANGIEYFVLGQCDSLTCQERNLNNDFFCPTFVEYVCGCNGITYSNSCEAVKDGVRDWTDGPCNTDSCEVDVDLICQEWLFEVIENCITEGYCSSDGNIDCSVIVELGSYNNQEIILVSKSCSDGVFNNSSIEVAYNCEGKIVDECGSFSLALWCDPTLANGVIIEHFEFEKTLWECTDDLPNCVDNCEVPASYIGLTEEISENTARLVVEQIDYELYDWRYKLKTNSNWIDLDSTTENSIELLDLIPCEEYEWQFRVRCDNESWSDWIGEYCFETDCPPEPCAIPSNYDIIISAITETSISLRFVPDNYLSYEWQYQPEFSNQWIDANSNSSEINLFGLSPCTTYIVRLRIQCDNGTWTDWLVEFSFDTECPPDPCDIPTSYEFEHSIIGNNIVRVTFTPDLGLIMEWRYKRQSENNWEDKTITDVNFIEFVDLVDCEVYDLEVRTQCANGEWSAWFGNYVFESYCPPAVCNIDNPLSIDTCLVTESSIQIKANYEQEVKAFDWRSRPVGINEWTSLGSTQTNSIDVFELASCQEYELSIRVLCNNDVWSDWSDGYFFTTSCPLDPCEIDDQMLNPDYIFETDNSISINLGINGFLKYYWRYRTVNTLNWTIDSSLINSINLPNLEECSEYELNVRVVCDNGEISDWVMTIGFESYCPSLGCEAPISANLGSGLITESSVRLEFAPANYLSYLWRYRMPSEGWIIGDTTILPFWDLTLLNTCQDYQWQVSIQCSNGEWSDWFGFGEFKTLCPPDPCLLDFAYALSTDEIQQNSALLRIDNFTFSNYRWQIKESTNNQWLFLGDGSSNEFKVTELSDCTDYQWQVSVQCSNGEWSDWFGFESFKTICPTMICEVTNDLTFNTSNVSFSSAQLEVSDQSFDAYLWRIRILGSTSWTILDTTSVPNIEIDDLESCQAYTWQSKVICDNEAWSRWIGINDFTTDCNPEDCQIPQSYELSNTQINASSFELKIDNQNYDYYDWRYQIENSSIWTDLDSSSTNTIVATNLESCNNYHWQIRVACAQENWSDWFGSITFETECPDTICFLGSDYFLTERNITETSATLVSDIPNQMLYEYQYKLENENQFPPGVISNTDTLRVNNLIRCEKYDWRVRVQCSTNSIWSDWTLNADFTAGCITSSYDSKHILINVYPNPTANILYIGKERRCDKLHLYNLNGALIQTYQNVNQIDLSQLIEGVYFIRMLLDNKWETHKVIKTN